MIRPSIVVGAEPFGYGPAAAATSIGQVFAERGCSVSFIGDGHTQELAAAVGCFDELTIPQSDAAERLMRSADIVVVAMDHSLATWATSMNANVVFYDALAWFWDTQPHPVTSGALWLCQDFFDVRTTTNHARHAGHATAVVSPLITTTSEDKHITAGPPVINLGGLVNPHFTADTVVEYARSMVETIASACQTLALPEPVVCGTRTAVEVAGQVGLVAQSYTPSHTVATMLTAPIVFATPGLANLYDSSAHDIPVVWLPPANDSQARQLNMVSAASMCDAQVTWCDLDASIEWTGRPQPQILAELASHISHIDKSQLHDRLVLAVESIPPAGYRLLSQLCDRFGRGSPEHIVDAITTHVQLTV